MRYHLDCGTQILASALFVEHIPVDLSGGQVGIFIEIFIYEPFVMAQIQVGLGSVLGDENFSMLVRAHGPRIYIDIRVQFLGRYS